MNTEIKYRTFDELLDEVMLEFKNYRNSDNIEPQQLIKVAKRVTKDIGLRISMTKEALLDVENNKVRLPEDFHVLNYALICTSRTIHTWTPEGTQIEERLIPTYSEYPELTDPCSPSAVNCGTTVAGCDCNNQPYESCNVPIGSNTTCETTTSTTNTDNTETSTNTDEESTYTSTCIADISGNPFKSEFIVRVVINNTPITIKQVGEHLSSASAILDKIITIGLPGTWTVEDATVNGGPGYRFTVVSTDSNISYDYLVYVGGVTEITIPFYCNITNTETTTITNNTTVTESTVNDNTVTCTNPCTKPRVILNCKGEEYEVVQVVNNSGLTYRYSVLLPLRLKSNPQTIDCGCPNLYINTVNQGWIKNNFLYTTFTTGKVYINYLGSLEDEDGNLLVPDHEILNEYYEYALKERILENLAMNDENVGSKLEYVSMKLRMARNNALSIALMPEFTELKMIHEANRKVMYNKYYNMFKSH